MSNESVLLRQLATAIEYCEALKGFDYPVPNASEIRLEWTSGSACSGYDETRKAIAAIVSARYSGLRIEAIAAAEKRIADIRADLQKPE